MISPLHFYGIDSALSGSTFTFSGGKMYQNGKELKDVAVAGKGLLNITSSSTTSSLLSPYPHYNVFYSYK